ncbi:ester cyclase [Nocardia sp. NPDC004068]|uniref:ester cyclase n=1 Tax=Nocardia sp. NPDC004068 TaxID=3364303 RepID=UPI0036AE5D36
MMTTRRAYDEVQRTWSAQRWDDWAATCAPAYEFDTGSGLRLDLAGTLAWNRAWFTAFPDYTEEIVAVHVTTDTAVAELSGRGTATAEFALGGRTLLPATGRAFELAYAKVLIFDADGKVVRDRQYQDRLGLYRQLGVG